MEHQETLQICEPENRIELLLYTNNNSLKVYLSKDSIMCNDRMETNNYDKSFSNFMDSGLLITHRKLIMDSINQNLVYEESMRPIILKLTFDQEDSRKIPALIIDEGLNVRWSSIKEYNMRTDIAAYILGQIPFNFVSGICFQNSDDRQAFNALLQNVAYPDELYREGFDILLGEEVEIDQSKLQSAINQKILESNFNISDSLFVVHLRDRIKAMVLSVISSFEISAGFYKINFDKTILEVIKENLSDILKKLNETDIYITEEEVTSKGDMTPFKYFIQILVNIVNEKGNSLLWVKEIKQDKSQIPKEEIAGYFMAIKSLINEDFESYNNIKWFENFKDVFINTLTEIESSREAIQKYKNKMNWLAEILDGKGRIADFLNDKDSESKLMNGLILFIKDSVSNDSGRLMADMDNFKFSIYEKRMTLVLFAALKGTAFLDKNLKKNALLNRISDEVALILTATDYLISDVCSINTYIMYRNVKDTIILSKKGYPLVAERVLDSEGCFKYLNEQLTQTGKVKNNKKKKLLELLLQNIIIPDKYFRYNYTLPKTQFIFKQDNEKIILISPVKAIEIKEFSEEDYINQVLKDFTKFSFEFGQQKDNWERLINALQTK